MVALLDAAMCAFAVYLAVYLRLGEMPQSGGVLWVPIVISVALVFPIFYLLGLYRTIFSHSGLLTLIEIGRACIIYGCLYSAVFTFGGIIGVPRTVGLIQPLILCVLASGSRLFARYWLTGRFQRLKKRHEQRALIYGAGSAGRQLAAAMALDHRMRVVGFIDDDSSLQGSVLNGRRIFSPQKLAELINRLKVSDVLLAIPSASQLRRNELIQQMRELPVHVRTLPGITDLAHGRVQLSDVRELEIEDLLGRQVVPPSDELLRHNITGKVVLVTGAGGSIGSELSRQAFSLEPTTLLLFDASEYSLYAIHHELNDRSAGATHPGPELIPLLGSVTDAQRMRMILETWRPDTIYHAAAYKHVPLVEHNPAEGIRNNLLGTWTIASLAAELRLPTFILISTDKAVRPTNVMGATKRGAELVLQALDSDHGGTVFAMVRFGNVLGSSGSVVPLFRRQIAAGGPITVTDRRITRFFMTIPEAAQLVIQASALARGGDVFLLDMGEPVRIVDLARNMIELSGYSVRDDENPAGDIAIEEIGLRPGEKLYEELLIGERPTPTSHRRIFTATEVSLPTARLVPMIEALRRAVDAGDVQAAISVLRALVPEFSTSDRSADWIYRASEQQAMARAAE